MLASIITSIKGFVAGLGVLLTILSGNFNLGAYNISGGSTYRLQSSIGTTNTSITLSSFKEPVSLIPYTMSYLNTSVSYGTLDPQTAVREFISFTGITQNSDGSATLTGVQRGLDSSYPFTASSTLRQVHSGQSIFILSNTPQHYNEYPIKRNTETISGAWTFSSTSQPRLDVYVAPTNDLYFATKKYVDDTASFGAPAASEITAGIVKLGTGLQIASSTSVLGSHRLVIPADLATSSPWSGATSTVPVTDADGKLNQAFFRFREQFNFLGNLAVGSTSPTSLFSVQGTSYLAGTTTVNHLTIASSTIQWNNKKYSLPPSSTASNTVMMQDGKGALYFIEPDWTLLGETTLGAPAATLTVSSLPARANYRVILYISSTGATSRALNFNDDDNITSASVNYGYKNFIDGTISQKLTADSYISLLATTTEIYYTLDIMNSSATNKFVNWSGTDRGQTFVNGVGNWQSMTQINKIDFSTAWGSNVGAGSYIKVYGSKD